MAAVEEAPLLRVEEGGFRTDFDSQALPKNVRNVFIAFGALSLIATLSTGYIVFALLSLVICSYIAYLLFKTQLLDHFESGDIYQALGFLKLGIWNAWFRSIWVSILFAIPLIFVFGAYAGSKDWANDICDIGKAMAEHGGVQDVEKKDMLIHALSLWQVKPVLMRGVYHYSKFRSQYGSYSVTGDSDFDNRIPDIFFEDGTKANPLIAEMLEALSEIPFLFMFVVLLTSQILIHAYPQVESKKHVTNERIMGESHSSFNTVAVGSACLGLGTSMTNYFIFNPTGGPIMFLLGSIFQMSIGAIIGMTMQKNSETMYTDEKKSVLLKPVLYKAYGGIAWGLCGIYFIKKVCPKIADMFDRGFVLPQDCAPFPFLAFLCIFITISQIALIWFVQKEAKTLFESQSP